MRYASGRIFSARFFLVLIGVLSLAVAGTCHAQATASNNGAAKIVETDSLALSSALVADGPSSSEGDPPASIPNAASTQTGEPSAASDWHLTVVPYIWLPGVHGTIGANGHDVSVHATPGDLLSNFR